MFYIVYIMLCRNNTIRGRGYLIDSDNFFHTDCAKSSIRRGAWESQNYFGVWGFYLAKKNSQKLSGEFKRLFNLFGELCKRVYFTFTHGMYIYV